MLLTKETQVVTKMLLAITLALLASALYFDLRYQRIPNKLCLFTLVFALALQAYIGQWHGIGQALLGAVLALVMLLPVFYFRCLGAGDVKLMVVVGALSGPIVLFWSVVYGVIFGTFTSFVLAFTKVGWSGIIKMSTQAFVKRDSASNKQKQLKVPYAPALALGWLMACYLSPEITVEIGPEIAALLASN